MKVVGAGVFGGRMRAKDVVVIVWLGFILAVAPFTWPRTAAAESAHPQSGFNVAALNSCSSAPPSLLNGAGAQSCQRGSALMGQLRSRAANPQFALKDCSGMSNCFSRCTCQYENCTEGCGNDLPCINSCLGSFNSCIECK